MSNSHTKNQELKKAMSLYESVWQKYEHGSDPESRFYIKEEKTASEALVILKQLEYEQAVLFEKITEATKNHSVAFRSYMAKKINLNAKIIP